ncbi:MAG TPA: hypothetical protein VGI35_11210 [Steroidobacteraceae bacterium]
MPGGAGLEEVEELEELETLEPCEDDAAGAGRVTTVPVRCGR